MRPKPPAWQWAEDNRYMPKGVTAKPGPYRIDRTPYLRQPIEDFDSPECQTVVLCMGTRLGKTEALNNLIGRTAHLDPKNILLCRPTIANVREYFRESIMPMFRHSPCFRSRIHSPTEKTGRNTALRKIFPGGQLRGIGANVPADFRATQAPIVIADEIDAMEDGKEGDPIELLFRRADNYPDAIRVLTSTPTVAGLSRIWAWLEDSDFQKWHVQSPRTGKWAVLDWLNVKWPEGEPEKATYLDPDTGEEWTEEERLEAIRNGKWVATKPFKGIRGYWADGMVSLFPPARGYKSKLHQFADEYERAKAGGPEKLRVWTNTFRALPSEEESEEFEWETIRDKAEDYGVDPIPEPVLVITAAADVQKDRIELEWVGWTDGYESYGLGYRVFPGDPKRPEVWRRLEEELKRTWKTTTGVDLRLARGLIDEGGHWQNYVRQFCLRLLSQGIEFYPCKGIGRNSILEPELITYRKSNKHHKGIQAPTYNIGVNRAKRIIFTHLLADPPGDYTMHFPKGNGYTDDYYQMLTGERIVTAYTNGRPYKKFLPVSGRRNEALDIRGYNLATVVSLNPGWDRIREKLEDMKPKTNPTPRENESLTEPAATVTKSVSRNQIRPPRVGGGFATNWR